MQAANSSKRHVLLGALALHAEQARVGTLLWYHGLAAAQLVMQLPHQAGPTSITSSGVQIIQGRTYGQGAKLSSTVVTVKEEARSQAEWAQRTGGVRSPASR